MDGGARGALTEFYAEAFAEYPGARCLDVGAGRLSHYPQSRTWEHMSITGLMEFELQGNSQADDFAVRDLNKIPELPYCSASFDIVTCAAAFKYFVRPLEILREMGRVLKPGGVLILSTSNRMFEEKAVRCWRQTRDDVEHCLIYASFVHYSGLFERPLARDVTPLLAKVGIGDPMYVVFAKRSQ
ncbi:unnamed protein product [Prorocentrum cordatum]|uniref:Methyltransferase type 11 domain-containing protein n=1 Tax=Prorocentrum cordatum TaxID=2364126 RepID=A0ABN9VXZ5_9DINO|nr:unnamed protein product [Polarella glacialis]|mmetsp:Transcript_102266/g.274943  ORF Transcript_102266/g.274943 Transcript_102266/m.274943 type:complete len:185 (-) Transcript_102266:68-622(-)